MGRPCRRTLGWGGSSDGTDSVAAPTGCGAKPASTPRCSGAAVNQDGFGAAPAPSLRASGKLERRQGSQPSCPLPVRPCRASLQAAVTACWTRTAWHRSCFAPLCFGCFSTSSAWCCPLPRLSPSPPALPPGKAACSGRPPLLEVIYKPRQMGADAPPCRGRVAWGFATTIRGRVWGRWQHERTPNEVSERLRCCRRLRC